MNVLENTLQSKKQCIWKIIQPFIYPNLSCYVQSYKQNGCSEAFLCFSFFHLGSLVMYRHPLAIGDTADLLDS